MNPMNPIFLSLFIVMTFLTASASGAYKGEIIFTEEEVKNHRQRALSLSQVSAACLRRYQQEHIEFYQRNCRQSRTGQKVCLSKFIGDRRYSKFPNQRRSDGARLEYLPEALVQNGFSASYAQVMEQISCVGLALNCLEEGFEKTNQKEQWQRIKGFVRTNNVSGTALQYALGELGWKTYYWNPSPYWSIEEDVERWDREERNWASKGWHAYRYRRVMNQGAYWFNNVDNATELVGFQTSIPPIMKRYPFWVGTAHTGYHVFPGTGEKVVEAHSTRHLTSFLNLEFSDFNPMQTGGGPRWTATEKYRSGLIVLPPL